MACRSYTAYYLKKMMRLSHLQIIGKEGLQDIHVRDGKIDRVSETEIGDTGPVIEFQNALAFPGLVNSHDHLDFNSFPRLGNPVYQDYTEWGKDINERYRSVINDVLRVPKVLRIKWGLYKNLLNGFTTVVNHGERLNTEKDLVTLFQDCNSLHSLHFEKNWKWKLNAPFKNKQPFVVHIGEGTNATAKKEIDTLIKANWSKRDLVGVHGVAMDSVQASAFRALVWCPASNFFLLNQTAPVDRLKRTTKIIFGTDSTLTSGWNAWEHLRMARETDLLSGEELMKAVTSTAAAVWKLNCGELATGKDADIVVAGPVPNTAGLDEFYALNPEDILLVLHKGEIRLFDESLLDHLKTFPGPSSQFSRIGINGRFKYIQGDLPGLIGEITRFYPDASFPVQAGQ
jgi:cytosine/adenosine deaminase-related metal-dependent hydrolase